MAETTDYRLAYIGLTVATFWSLLDDADDADDDDDDDERICFNVA